MNDHRCHCRSGSNPGSGQANELCHLHLELGELRLDYAARRQQAEAVAAELITSTPGVTVTIDNEVKAGLPQLPCGELWD